MGPEHSHGLDVYFTIPTDEYLRHIPDTKGAMKLFFNADEAKMSAVEESVKEYCEVIWPILVCIPVFTMISVAVSKTADMIFL